MMRMEKEIYLNPHPVTDSLSKPSILASEGKHIKIHNCTI